MRLSFREYEIEIKKLKETFDYAKKLQKSLDIVVDKIEKDKEIKDDIGIIMQLNDLSYDLYETYQDAVKSALKIIL